MIERAQGGDRGAFDDLLSAHEAGARRLAISMGMSWDDAADAAQEAAVRAYRAIRRFRLGEPFRPWYMQIVANEVRGLHRRAGRRSRLAERLSSVREAIQEGPEHDALEKEQATAVVLALDVLCDLHRQTIVCRYLKGWSEAETAAALGIPKGTVKSRVSRGLSRMRLALIEPRPSEAA